MCQHRLDEGKLANAWGNAEVPPQEITTFLCLQEMDSNVLLYDAELSCVCRPSTLHYVMKRSAHLHVLIKLAEEVLLQAVAQIGCKAAAAVDAESCRQRLAQRRHERIPLPLRHNALRLKPYLKVAISQYAWPAMAHAGSTDGSIAFIGTVCRLYDL